ncbi:MAG: RidA family protein [Flammeovirgaceae bacterium]
MKFLAKSLLLACIVFSVSQCQQAPVPKEKEAFVKRYDRPDATILKGVEVSEGNAYFFSSGMVGPVLDTTAALGDPKRYGDTYTQSIGALTRIEASLKEAGLSMKDVIKLNVYIAPDQAKEGVIDFEAWFNAYKEFFVNEKNPNKVARTTLGVAALAREGLLVEVEVIAVYPK